MNKRKVLSILLLALITVALAVSCSSNIETPVTNTEELAYVTFGNGHSRELGASYSTKDYNSLFWFYTAIKDDQYGMTGVKTDKTPVRTSEQAHLPGLDGQVGPLSQGKWIFTLFAYETSDSSPSGNLVYQSKPVSVTLKGGDVKNVPVSVSLQGESGKVSISNVKFYWANGGGSASPKASLHFVGNNSSNDFYYIADTLDYVGGDDAYFKLSVTDIPFNNVTNSIPADYYTVTAKVYLPDSEDTPLATQTFGLRVYGNAITVITGDLTEGLFAEVIFDVAKQDMKVFVPSPTERTIISGITAVPDNTVIEGVPKSTTVEFEAGALSSVGANQLQLDVKVTPVESANEKFNITGTIDNKSAFAGIDLTLTDSTGTNKVSNFAEGKYATITTYIAKGLSGVVVNYNGDGDQPIATDNNNAPDKTVAAELTSNSSTTALGYNKENGLLRFKTNHFSEYYVLAECEAVNISTNVGYKSLADAIHAAGSGETIKLIKNSSGSGLGSADGSKTRESLIIDFNGYTYTMKDPAVGSTGTETQAMHWGKSLGSVTMKNGTFNIVENPQHVYMAMQNYINFTAEKMTFGFTNIPVNHYGNNYTGADAVYNGLEIPLFNNGRGGTMTLRNCHITMPESSVKGISNDGNEIIIDSCTINGAVVMESANKVVKVKNSVITKGVSPYFNSGYAVKTSEEDGYTVYTNKTAVEISTTAELNDAISEPNNGNPLYFNVLNNVTLDNGIANEGAKSRDITFIGTNRTQTVDVITNTVNAEGGQLNYQRGSSFTFENLTIKAGEGSFDGIVCNELTFKNCTITGKLTLFGKATFINCVFNNTMDDQYSIWTWGGTDVKFEGCTFNTNGKAILLYGGASGSNPTNLVVNSCTFNDSKNGAAGKAAIEIGNDYNATYNLTVKNATINGFALGKNTNSKVWANKNSMDAAHLTVTIDGNRIQ